MLGGLLVTCKDVEHCPSDTFCDAVDLVCRPCIQCVDLQRGPPPTAAPVTCITSAAQCGSCFTGLIENKKSLNMECVEANTSSAWDEWLVMLVALHLLALLLCVCVALVLRNFRAYKLRASTSVEAGMAPLPPPPPYNPTSVLSPYNPTSAVLPSQNLELDETSSPLIRVTPLSLQPEATVIGIPAPSSKRETARLQGARVFCEANTSDEDYPPSSTEIIQHDPERPEPTHNSTVHHYNGTRSEITLSNGSHAMDKSIPKAFKCPAKKQRVRQDSDRTNDSEDSGYGEPHASMGGPGPTIFTSNNSIPFFINVFKNFTTVSQDDESVF